jgi:hypothetical protein
MAIHFFYAETATLIIECLASGGHLLQAREQEAG